MKIENTIKSLEIHAVRNSIKGSVHIKFRRIFHSFCHHGTNDVFLMANFPLKINIMLHIAAFDLTGCSYLGE